MDSVAELIGGSDAIVSLRRQIQKVLGDALSRRLPPPLLLQGETGTGKGLTARVIHQASPRAQAPFVHVNCAAIPETLLEAELFGYERGAFTGAQQSKPGLFQAAQHGTLFLDEIGLLPEPLQAKLLNVLEEKVIRRLGAIRSERVDVWVLAATNVDLAAAARQKRFRADLYHRLAVITLVLPPLRQRAEDVLLLADRFLVRACVEHGVSPKALADDAHAALRAYSWPGNVRELANVMERVALLTEGDVVTARMLGLPATVLPEPPADGARASSSIEDVVRERLETVLIQTGWNVTRTAGILGITRNTARAHMRKFGLRPAAGSSQNRATIRQPLAREAALPTTPVAGVGGVAGHWERRRLGLVLLRVSGNDSDEAHGLTLLHLLRDKITSFAGHIEGIGPSALLATFGLDGLDEAVVRAGYAAVAIQRAAGRESEEDRGLALTVAIHTIEALTDVASAPPIVDPEARRRAWNALDALAERAESGDIVASADAANLLTRRFEVRRSDGDPEIYRVRSARRGAGLFHRRTRLVGRLQELALLRQRFELAAAGRGQVVGIAGEPGIGKSRLVVGLRQSVGGEELACVEAQCLPLGSSVPYFPIAQLVRVACGIGDDDDRPTVARKVAAALETLGLDNVDTAPWLLHLLGAMDTAATDPEMARARIFDVTRRFLARKSRVQPLVIVIEDLQWVDPTSGAFVAMLVDSVSATPILLVATYRSGYTPGWIGKSYATQLTLPPLAIAESTELVEAVLASNDATPELVRRIVAAADGNPLFLEELARAVSDAGPGSSALRIPDSVKDVIAARMQRIDDGARGLLQTAAVLGRTVSPAVLSRVHDEPLDVPLALAELVRHEFIIDTAASGVTGDARARRPATEAGYVFKHALTEDVAYEALPAARRRELHRRAVATIEELYADRLREHVDELGHHTVAGELWSKAADYLRQAGVHAALRSASTEAVVRFDAALRALAHLPPSRESLERGIALRFDLRNPLFVLADFHRAIEVLADVVRLAESLDQPRHLALASAYMANAHFMLGDLDRGAALGERARTLATKLDDPVLDVITHCALGQLAFAAGDHAEAVALMRHSLGSLDTPAVAGRAQLAGLYTVVARCFEALALSQEGAFPEALASAERCLAVARTTETPFLKALAFWACGTVHLTRGEFVEAIQWLGDAHAVCEASDLRAIRPWIASEFGRACLRNWRVAEAIGVLEASVAEAEALHLLCEQSLRLASLASALHHAGRRRDAIAFAERAVVLAERLGERGCLAHALCVRGELAAAGPDGERGDAVTLFERALKIAAELGMRPLVAHCHAGLATVHWRSGAGDECGRHAEAASLAYRTLGMSAFLDRMESTLGRWRSGS